MQPAKHRTEFLPKPCSPEAAIDEQHGKEDFSHSPAILAPSATWRAEAKAIDELRNLLRYCIMTDYCRIQHSYDGLADFALRIPKEVRNVHFSTPTTQWYDLSTAMKQPTSKGVFRRFGIFSSKKTPEEIETYLLEHVDRPAENLGLDKERVRRRLELYIPTYWHLPESMLTGLALKGRWKELAKKAHYDKSYIEILFSGILVLNKTTKKMVALADVMRSAIDHVQKTWFTKLEMNDNRLRYSISSIPGDIFLGSAQERAAATISRELRGLSEMQTLQVLLRNQERAGTCQSN